MKARGHEKVFETEAALVTHFLKSLRSKSSPWPNLRLREQFTFDGGRPDVVAVNSLGKVIVFEAKLKRWRDALDQAYRNTTFADQSYVVLPQACASAAKAQRAEFSRRRVGLVVVGKS